MDLLFIINYTTINFTMHFKVDHFSFAVQDTFKLRYLLNDTWRKTENAPIFFYTGNEGRIEVFAENTVRAIINYFYIY